MHTYTHISIYIYIYIYYIYKHVQSYLPSKEDAELYDSENFPANFSMTT